MTNLQLSDKVNCMHLELERNYIFEQAQGAIIPAVDVCKKCNYVLEPKLNLLYDIYLIHGIMLNPYLKKKEKALLLLDVIQRIKRQTK